MQSTSRHVLNGATGDLDAKTVSTDLDCDEYSLITFTPKFKSKFRRRKDSLELSNKPINIKGRGLYTDKPAPNAGFNNGNTNSKLPDPNLSPFSPIPQNSKMKPLNQPQKQSSKLLNDAKEDKSQGANGDKVNPLKK